LQTPDFAGQNYGAYNFAAGKFACKKALQREFGLPQIEGQPLVAMVGRLADQKGFDLVAEVIRQWAETSPVQWVILGTGDPKYHDLLTKLAQLHPDRVAVRLDFSNELAHRIEAGADIFLMPSRYEPCGLNQLYSLKYGTVPVVHATGGLADTITNLSDETLAAGTANGFSFENYSPVALAQTLERACQTYFNRSVWDQLIRTGMNQDWSWHYSAQEYSRLYEVALARRGSALCEDAE
jgi:starch synthase